jgi:hypothetical protein
LFKEEKFWETLMRSQNFIIFYSSMMAVARDDFHVYIIDIDTRKVVRKFIGHDNRITDMVSID